MNKKKGFTLVELMAILVILGVILIMAVPSITGTLKNSKKNRDEEIDAALCNAARSYLNIHKEDSVEVSKLVEDQYVRDNLIDKENKRYNQKVEVSKTDSSKCIFK